MDWNIAIILIFSGIVVGIINTLAGGGSIITMTLFAALGLPLTVANGSNRIAVFLQNFASTVTFIRKRLLNIKHGVLLSIPVIIGNFAGSIVATHINDSIFKICFGAILVIILLYMCFENRIRMRAGNKEVQIKKWHYLWFLLIGFYGGYIYIGIGYIILAITLATMHMDVVTANVIKGFVIFIATPFSLAVFIINGHVDYSFGLIHGVGNMIGSFLASHYMVGWGKGFIKGFMVVIMLICFADLVGIISLHDIFISLI